jgi:hypothetical protein
VKDALQESREAITALKQNPAIFSESYLSAYNGTDGKCTDGVPDSKVTCMCLKTGGYEETEAGLEKAIVEGWASVNIESHGINVLGESADGLKWWREKKTDTTISFPVNPFVPRVFIATEKNDDGDFVVGCLSTDGGGIPRNVIIESGLSLVKMNALSMEEFVLKTSRNPARCLGLNNKGHLDEGMDADITVLDFASQKARITISNGDVVMWNGLVCGKGTHFITTSKGADNVADNGLTPYVTK